MAELARKTNLGRNLKRMKNLDGKVNAAKAAPSTTSCYRRA